MVPLILLSYVPDLKTLAVCSQIANVLMGCTIGITLYYIFGVGAPLKDPMTLDQIAPVADLPEYFSLVIFAMECIGVVSISKLVHSLQYFKEKFIHLEFIIDYAFGK